VRSRPSVLPRSVKIERTSWTPLKNQKFRGVSTVSTTVSFE
jgi:hypothetical protein